MVYAFIRAGSQSQPPGRTRPHADRSKHRCPPKQRNRRRGARHSHDVREVVPYGRHRRCRLHSHCDGARRRPLALPSQPDPARTKHRPFPEPCRAAPSRVASNREKRQRVRVEATPPDGATYTTSPSAARTKSRPNARQPLNWADLANTAGLRVRERRAALIADIAATKDADNHSLRGRARERCIAEPCESRCSPKVGTAVQQRCIQQ
jgi:hypothetical protein